MESCSRIFLIDKRHFTFLQSGSAVSLRSLTLFSKLETFFQRCRRKILPQPPMSATGEKKFAITYEG